MGNEKNIIKCLRCEEEAEIETENGFLCNSCDCIRLECLNNTDEEMTEADFWNEVKYSRH